MSASANCPAAEEWKNNFQPALMTYLKANFVNVQAIPQSVKLDYCSLVQVDLTYFLVISKDCKTTQHQRSKGQTRYDRDRAHMN